MEYNFDDIFKVVITNADKKTLLNLLDDISTGLFKEIKKESHDTEENEISKALLASLAKNKIEKSSTQKMQDFITHLKEKIDSLKTVNVIIAIEPTEKIKDLFSAWAKDKYSKEVLFDVDVDERILGGAIIIDNGQYFDYSLLSKLDDIFKNKRKEVIDPILQS